MGIPARAKHLADLDLYPLEVRFGQSLTDIQNFDADDATALVTIEDDPRAHFFRLNDASVIGNLRSSRSLLWTPSHI